MLFILMLLSAISHGYDYAGPAGGTHFSCQSQVRLQSEWRDFVWLGWTAGLDCKKAGNYTYSMKVSPGLNALRFALLPGEETTKPGSWKNELRDRFSPELGEEVEYTLETFVAPNDLPKRNESIVIAQWHNVVIKGATPKGEIPRIRPPLSIRIVDHHLHVYLWNDDIWLPKQGQGQGHLLYREPIRFGEWYRFQINARWTHLSSGYINLSINDENVVDWRGPTVYERDHIGPYFKFGLYTVHPFHQRLQLMHRNYSAKVLR